MNFITIDFETATSDRDSPCEIGLTFVENDKIKGVRSWLIKPSYYPHFNHFNTSIHGIKPDDVKDAPEFGELWPEIEPLVKGQFLIAHNARFDINVLQRTLNFYRIPFPELHYSCSYMFSKEVWKGLPSYDLKTLCRINKIALNHHRAGDDSEATAKLCLKAFELADVRSLEDFPIKLKTTIGQLYRSGYRPSETIRQYNPSEIEKIIGDPSTQDPESIFYGHTIVFTGALMSMSRKVAQKIIEKIGGNNGKGVTKQTNFLVVGQQDYRVVGDDGMSSKQAKAIKIIEKGSQLEIISEDEFLRNI